MTNNRSDHIQQNERTIWFFYTTQSIKSQAWGTTILYSHNNSNHISFCGFVSFSKIASDAKFFSLCVKVKSFPNAFLFLFCIVRTRIIISSTSESIEKFILLFDYTLYNTLELQLKLVYILFSYDVLAENIYLLITFSNSAVWANRPILILKHSHSSIL